MIRGEHVERNVAFVACNVCWTVTVLLGSLFTTFPVIWIDNSTNLSSPDIITTFPLQRENVTFSGLPRPNITSKVDRLITNATTVPVSNKTTASRTRTRLITNTTDDLVSNKTTASSYQISWSSIVNNLLSGTSIIIVRLNRISTFGDLFNYLLSWVTISNNILRWTVATLDHVVWLATTISDFLSWVNTTHDLIIWIITSSSLHDWMTTACEMVRWITTTNPSQTLSWIYITMTSDPIIWISVISDWLTWIAITVQLLTYVMPGWIVSSISRPMDYINSIRQILGWVTMAILIASFTKVLRLITYITSRVVQCPFSAATGVILALITWRAGLLPS